MTWYGVLVPLDLGVCCLARHTFPDLDNALVPYLISRFSNSPRSLMLRQKCEEMYVDPIAFCRKYLDTWMLSDNGLTISPSDDGSLLFVGLDLSTLVPSPINLTELNCLIEKLREVRLNEVDIKIKTLGLLAVPDIYFGDFAAAERFPLVNSSHLLRRLER